MVAAKLIDSPEGRQRIDRYELVAEIASGGMATVFLARLSGVGGFQRFVAIKRLHPHLAAENEFVEMFLDEARLAAGIHHPNVVPILEVGASDRGYYLVMEYIEGDTLARLLARAASSGNKLPVKIGIRVILDMLAGLHGAHELKDDMGQPTELVHRDVSPQNVLVGVDGISRITDFGVARAASRLTATRVGQLKGKIAYMAPEQATGQPDVDRRADVFSSGIVLWEVLAARRLFKSENEAATLSRVISEPIPLLTTMSPDLNPQIAAVCMKALERDPQKRYATCAQFADALERAATTAGEIAAPREVAAYVSEVIGNEISQAREAVRAWLARSEPSQVAMARGRLPSQSGASPASSVSAAAMALPESSYSEMSSYPTGYAPAAGPHRSKTPLVLGLVVALVVVGGAAIFFAFRSSTATDRATTSRPVASGTVGVAGGPGPAVPPSAEAANSAKPAASAEADAGAEPSASASIKKPAAPPVHHFHPRPTHVVHTQPKATASPPQHKTDGVDLSNPYR